MEKCKFVIHYKNGTVSPFFTTVPSLPSEAFENATSYTCCSAQSRKISSHHFGYIDTDAREETWYWTMNLPMKEEEVITLESFEYNCAICGEPSFTGKKHLCGEMEPTFQHPNANGLNM